NLTLSGAISGPGALTLNGAGTVTLTGSTANTYGGITHVSAGTLALNKTLFDQTIPHDLIIDGTVTYLNNNQVPNSANVTINGLLNLNNFVEGLGTINGNGNITFGTGLLDMYDTTDCIFGGGMSGTGVTGIEQFGTSKITLNGNNTYTGTTRVASGELVINGLQPQSAVRVDAGATLGGAGTVGAIAANGRISPGNSPGILTSRIESTNVVSGFAGPLEKVAVSIWLTHPIDSDLSLSLISPDGTLVQLALNIGAGANFGSACSPDANRTTFDDSAATPITTASPPFVGTFRPQGTLGNFINTTANGNWRLRITDSFAGSLGALRCWSLFLYPAACTAGGGLCELCPNVTITAATGPATPTQINYLTFNGTPSTRGVPKV